MQGYSLLLGACCVLCYLLSPDFDDNLFPGVPTLKSIRELKADYVKGYPTHKLVTIPVVRLQDYKSVPFHLTEDDVRANINAEEKEMLTERSRLLEQKKGDVLAILDSWSFNTQSHQKIQAVSTKLNNLLFEEIIASADCACPKCQLKVCSNKNATQCSVHKGDTTKIARAKAGFQHRWKDALQKLQPNLPDQNFEILKELTLNGVVEGIQIKMQKEIHGVMGNMKGRNSENRLARVFDRVA